MKVKVFAKLNLTLNVGAKQGEFHPIDSVVTSVDLFDVVEVTSRPDSAVTVTGMDNVGVEQNTAYKAAEAFVALFGTNGVDICVRKGIPFASGLGGSSADAAAVVYCMCELYGVDARSAAIHNLCARLGSDINFMLFGGLARLRGKGDDIVFYDVAMPLYFALTTFEVAMSSKSVYDAFDRLANLPSDILDSASSQMLDTLQTGNVSDLLPLMGNDLQRATNALSNYAEQYLQFARANGLSCNMTGSGSAYYVVCGSQTEAQDVAKLLTSNGFVTVACKSVPKGIDTIN